MQTSPVFSSNRRYAKSLAICVDNDRGGRRGINRAGNRETSSVSGCGFPTVAGPRMHGRSRACLAGECSRPRAREIPGSPAYPSSRSEAELQPHVDPRSSRIQSANALPSRLMSSRVSSSSVFDAAFKTSFAHLQKPACERFVRFSATQYTLRLRLPGRRTSTMKQAPRRLRMDSVSRP